MRVNRWIWSEQVSSARGAAPEVLERLARWNVGLLLAVTPDSLERTSPVLAAAARRGVPVGLWPMTRDRDGRWLSVGTAEAFERHLAQVWQVAGRTDAPVCRLVFDLEPPLEVVRGLVRGRAARLRRSLRGVDGPAGRRAIARMVSEARRQGVETVAAVAPPVVFDPVRGPDLAERVLGTPVHGMGFDRIHAMLYTSLLEGYVPKMTRRAARRVLAWGCRRARARFGARAAVSLGLSGGGALGDERAYRSPDELAEDVAIARAAGIAEIALHGLGGALDRPPPDAWLTALSGRNDTTT